MATNIPPVADNEIIATAWGNQVRTEVSNLEANKYAKSGGQITGNVNIAGTLGATGAVGFTSAVTLSTPGSQYFHAVRKDQLDAINTSVAATYLPLAGGRLTGMTYVGPGDGLDTAAVMLNPTGQMRAAIGTLNVSSLALTRMGTSGAQGAGQRFIDFRRGTVVIGSIMINAATTGVDYNTTSDRRLKEDLGPVDDPLGVVERLQPRHLRWLDSGAEYDGFLADDVQGVVPTAVHGQPDAVEDDGTIAPQMLDASKLIPYLVGAVQQLTARVRELEAV